MWNSIPYTRIPPSRPSKFELMLEAENYLRNINRYFKLDISCVFVPFSDDQFKFKEGVAIAMYRSTWRIHGSDPKYKYGQIVFNCELLSTYSKEKIFETVRHELAHAIVDIRLGGDYPSHGRKWMRVAKLLRVDISQYLNCTHN